MAFRARCEDRNKTRKRPDKTRQRPEKTRQRPDKDKEKTKTKTKTRQDKDKDKDKTRQAQTKGVKEGEAMYVTRRRETKKETERQIVRDLTEREQSQSQR